MKLCQTLEQLISENVLVNAIALKLYNGEEVPLYLNKTYRDANRRLLNLIARWGDPEYPTERYLVACARYVMELE